MNIVRTNPASKAAALKGWVVQKKGLFRSGIFWLSVVTSLLTVFFLFAYQLSGILNFSPYFSDIYLQLSKPAYRVLFLTTLAFTSWRYGIKSGLVVCVALGILISSQGLWNRATPFEWIDFVAVAVGLLLMAIVGRQGEIQHKLKETSLELEKQSVQLKEEIIERKRSEEKLLFKNALLVAQSETAIDGILAVNENHEIVLCNRRLQDMWHLPVNLLETGMHEMIFRHMVSQTENSGFLFGKSPNELANRMEQGQNEIKMLDGRIFDAYSSPLIDTNGVLRGRIWYFRDVTERKEMEQRLIMTDRLASIGELVSGIAHELNNPLTGVIGYSQLIMEQDIRDDLRDDLTVISSEAQRAAGIVKDLLTFARKHSPVKELCRLNNVIDDVLKLRAYEHKTNNIEVVKDFDPLLPETMLDYRQIQQVFLNLVINAEFFMVKEHRKGQLTIKTESANGFVRSTVTDNGPGIPEENLRRIFDPFFTTKEEGKGTGLGLSICHGIVTEHGGRIYARNDVGRGASFIIDLPVTISDGQPSK